MYIGHGGKDINQSATNYRAEVARKTSSATWFTVVTVLESVYTSMWSLTTWQLKVCIYYANS
ncbi:hypothetical protein HOLleu_30373 [Holothuria leucospilota]|uniref:Uncharacterized protein n=1 Tax=Holothuria leucospilota TaxID=206669 RepID=A0A9Q1BKB1_HOLLE|nr:hypothetical protein HOLleu_30373 [Holothuria leucospilota]